MDPLHLTKDQIAYTKATDATLEVLNLAMQLKDSGLLLPVTSLTCWADLTEIFVNESYDFSIRTAFQLHRDSKDKFRVLDLGANLGFFTFRACELYHRSRHTFDGLEIVCVEANPSTFKKLRTNLECNSTLSGTVKCLEGAVGKKSGTVSFSNYLLSNFNTTSKYEGGLFDETPDRIDVPYLDLDTVYPDSIIDFLKCDIEGSEQLFFENHPGLLQRTRAMVVELHPEFNDIPTCLRFILEAGLKHHRLLAGSLSNKTIPSLLFASREEF